MDFVRMLDHCRSFEERVAALYRRFAAAARENPALCTLWTQLAREEEGHARSIAALGSVLRPTDAAGLRLDGWSESLAEVAAQLAAAEALPPGASVDRQLVAALELERTELDAARRALLAAAHFDPGAEPTAEHATRLADAATRFSDAADVRLAAVLLRTHALLNDRAHAPV